MQSLINQLPVWATYIVIAYGKYHAAGASKQFVNDFKLWCNNLDKDVSNCWVLPFNVFNMAKTLEANNFTIDAMVIYDILLNGCFYPLIDEKIPMDSSYIAKLIKEYQPDKVHDVHTRFTRQKVLIDSINLHPTTSNELEEEA